MPNSTQTAKTVLQYQVDQAGVAQVISANAKVAASASGAADALGTIGKFNTTPAVKQVDALTASANRLRDAFKDASSSASFADPTAGGSGGLLGALENAQSTGLGRVGSQLRSLPSIQIPGAGIGTDAVANLLRAGGALEALGVSAGALGAVVGIGIPVVLAAVAAISIYNNDLKENTEKVKVFGEALNQAFGAGTTVAIEGLKAQAEQEQKNAQATVDKLKAEQAAAPSQLSQTAQGAVNSLATDLAGAANSITLTAQSFGLVDGQAQLYNVTTQETVKSAESYNDEITAQQKIVDDATLKLQGYNAALGTVNVANADTASAIDTLSKIQLDAAQFAATATTESVKKRLDADQLERQYLEAESAVLAAQHTTEADKIQQEVDARIFLLGIQDQAIEGFKEEIAARDAANQAAKEQARVLKSARDTIVKYEADSKKANDDIAKLSDDHAATIVKIEQDAADKRTQVAADEAEKERQAAIDRDEKLKDANQKASDDLVKLAEDTADKRARIERDYARSAAESIQDRDAVSLDRAKTKRDDDLKDLKDANAKQKAAIKKALADQQAAIEAAYQKQLTTARDAAQKALNLAAQAESRALSIEADKYTKELAYRQQALNAMTAQYQAFLANLKYAADTNKPPANAITPTVTQLNGADFAKWAHDNGIPGYATGGMVPRTGLIYAHQGERVLTAQQQRNMAGAGMTINFRGMSEGVFIQHMRKAFRQYNSGLRAAS